MKIAKNTPAPITVDSVRNKGVDFAADGKLTGRERSMLFRDFRKLGTVDRGAALEALRGAAPKAALAVTPAFGPRTVEDVRARIATDLDAGPSSKSQGKASNALTRAGISERTLDNYFRLGSDEQLQVRSFLTSLGFSDKDVRAFTAPRPAFPSWSAFAQGGKYLPTND